MKTPTKIILFFVGMFPAIYFQNEIIINFINIIGWKASNLNDKIDKTINKDI